MPDTADDLHSIGRFTNRLVRFVLLLGSMIVGALALFVYYEYRESIVRTEANLELVSRSLEQRTSLILGYARNDLKALAARIEATTADEPTVNAQRYQNLLIYTGGNSNPWLRSISVIDAQGNVLVSSNPANIGLLANMAAWGELPNPDQGVILGPLLTGRDVPTLHAAAPQTQGATAAPVLLLMRALALPDRQVVYLITLINLDYFSNQFSLLMRDSGTQIALMNYEGLFLAGTDDLDLKPGQSLSGLPVFSQFLPDRESGRYRGNGIGLSDALVTFRSVRDTPLVVLAQRSYSLIEQELRPLVVLIGAAGLLLVSLIGLFVAYARRSVQKQDKSQMELATALKLALHNKTFYEAIQSSALDAIIAIDTQDQILAFNAAAEQMFGYQASFAIGKNISDLIVPKNLREHHRHGVRNFGKTELTSVMNRRRQTTAQRADGAQFPIEISVVSVKIADKQCFIGTIRDISTLKNDEAERTKLLSEYGNVARDLGLINEELAKAKQRELEIGTQIQQTMLVNSEELPNTGLWKAIFNQASKGIDGDFFDVMMVNATTFDVLAGDVMGKGVPAALMGAATKLQFNRTMVALLLDADDRLALPQPAAIVSHVNQAMAPQLQALDAFVTLVYIRIDLENNAVTWVGCGHEEALLFSEAGTSRLLHNQHPPMGVLLAEVFEQSNTYLGPADALFLASDGASDALKHDGQHLGRELLNTCIQHQLAVHHTPSMALHTLRRNLLADNVSLTDDLTLALFCRYARQRDVMRIQVPIKLSALLSVREFIGERTQKADFSEPLSAVVMVAIVELVTNVIRHAQGLLTNAPVELIGEIGSDGLTIECKYLGDYFRPETIVDTDFGNLPDDGIRTLPEGGFGLSIIHQVADEVHYLHEDGVNNVRLLFRGHQPT